MRSMDASCRLELDALDNTSSLRGFGPLPNSPCADFVGTASEIPNELDDVRAVSPKAQNCVHTSRLE
jgi:hypothetical protein